MSLRNRCPRCGAPLTRDLDDADCLFCGYRRSFEGVHSEDDCIAAYVRELGTWQDLRQPQVTPATAYLSA